MPSCRACSTPLDESVRFCPQCGARVEPAEAPTEESAIRSVEADEEPRLFGVPPSLPLWQSSLGAVRSLRARAGAAVETYGAVSAARRRLALLRHEHEELLGRRDSSLRALGEAVYRGDDEATEAARADLTGTDEALRAKEAEMTSIADEVQERVHAAHDEVRKTELLEPGPSIPEPSPPPDEGTPPMPEPVPEPYPPPDEADIPSPDPGEPGSKA